MLKRRADEENQIWVDKVLNMYYNSVAGVELWMHAFSLKIVVFTRACTVVHLRGILQQVSTSLTGPGTILDDITLTKQESML